MKLKTFNSALNIPLIGESYQPSDSIENIKFGYKSAKLPIPDIPETSPAIHELYYLTPEVDPCDRVIREFLSHDIKVRDPKELHIKPGWHQYTLEGDYVGQLLPTNHIVFDVETHPIKQQNPVLAAALSPYHYWLWFNPELERTLVDLPYTELVINHNAHFDKARTRQAYKYPRQIKWLDTMSMSKVTNGFSKADKMMSIYMKWRRTGDDNMINAFPWLPHVTRGNLADCYNFYCKPSQPMTEADKTIRKDFVKNVDIYQGDIRPYVHYALTDVWVAYQLAKALFPRYLRKVGKVALKSHLLMSEFLYPVSSNWQQWLKDTENEYRAGHQKVSDRLGELGMSEEYEQLPIYPLWNSGLREGMPRWVRADLHNGKRWTIGLGHWEAPYILKARWNGFPLSRRPIHLWGYTDNGGEWHKLPSEKDGVNCSSPFNDFIIDKDELTVRSDAADIMDITKGMCYWKGKRKRAKETPIIFNGDGYYIAESFVPHTTITRRSGSPMFGTACQYKPGKLGSDLKLQIQPHKGRLIMHADYASQEFWEACLAGDSLLGEHGSFKKSWIANWGNRADGTDPHSSLAAYISQLAQTELKRQDAKGINFAGQYGGKYPAFYKHFKKCFPDGNHELWDMLANASISALYGNKNRLGKYYGGIDSQYLNWLDQKKKEPIVRTLMFGVEITEGFNPVYFRTKNKRNSRFLNSCWNYFIQSTGRDLLDYLIVVFDQLRPDDVLLLVSNHDEIVLHVPDDYETVRATAKALQIAHFSSWYTLAKCLGFTNIPQKLALFPEIDVDRYWRKDSNGATPDNAPNAFVIRDGWEFSKQKFEEWKRKR